MIIFTDTNGKQFTDSQLEVALAKHNLYGKSVFVFSRLLSFGKLEGLEKRYRHGKLLVEEVMWKNNERNGPSHSYINGKKISYWYLNGKQVSEKIYQELSKDKSTE